MNTKLLSLLSMLILATMVDAQSTMFNSQSAKPDSTQHVIVCFFSATGNTRMVAKRLAAEHNARLWDIPAMETYTEADLDWRDSTSRSSLEMKDPHERPIIRECTNIEAYDTVYLGFPIWWGICPRIINSWIDNNILDGKVIIPFATSGSSPIEPAVEYLRKTYPDVRFADGILLNDYLKK